MEPESHHILGGIAEFERELIRARTDDGRKRAKAHAPQAHIPSVRQEALQRLGNGETQADIARTYVVDPPPSAGCNGRKTGQNNGTLAIMPGAGSARCSGSVVSLAVSRG